ncbi:hypothetical protein [Halomicrococcus sp. NG-SE-24]|uniref:hypothetical protein n=1 Tax=Halomicrococcus sp. NG-SE-24 TaxID=3436928 RepID=UPI003D98C313
MTQDTDVQQDRQTRRDVLKQVGAVGATAASSGCIGILGGGSGSVPVSRGNNSTAGKGMQFPAALSLELYAAVFDEVVNMVEAGADPTATLHADQPSVGRGESLAVQGTVEAVGPVSERLIVVRFVKPLVLPGVDEFVSDRLAELLPADLLVAYQMSLIVPVSLAGSYSVTPACCWARSETSQWIALMGNVGSGLLGDPQTLLSANLYCIGGLPLVASTATKGRPAIRSALPLAGHQTTTPAPD